MLNKILKLFSKTSEKALLGRWCHISLPNCGNKIIERKIDFALMDNDIGGHSRKYIKTETKKFNTQDYINYWYGH